MAPLLLLDGHLLFPRAIIRALTPGLAWNRTSVDRREDDQREGAWLASAARGRTRLFLSCVRREPLPWHAKIGALESRYQTQPTHAMQSRKMAPFARCWNSPRKTSKVNAISSSSLAFFHCTVTTSGNTPWNIRGFLSCTVCKIYPNFTENATGIVMPRTSTPFYGLEFADTTDMTSSRTLCNGRSWYRACVNCD